ncbi:alkaline phosphatase-like protein, partial [Rozella allomycis CSF55]
LTVLFIGLVFHCIYLFSIFDIYFRTPIVHGMTPHRVEADAPAKRLVLIVGKSFYDLISGDGLRADKLFESNFRAPYLHSLIANNATYGISHTRVPTESRPGHVAIIAGFYEDVSSVTKGWKMNPVEFDSVFNQSRHTWSFGSPDILPMFKHGARDTSKIETFMYDSHFEDFSKDAIELDKFSFDMFDELLKNATNDHILHERLHSDQIVFFLHLLGLDTNGHTYGPHSESYYKNIKYVDKKIKELESKLNEFYNHDRKTAYIFTADHGMSDLGSHGDGDPDNTRTPIIAWGAGINFPVKALEDKILEDYSKTWPASKFKRNDINQADVAPLMQASLIGIPFPVNSVGEIPFAYLNSSEKFKSLSLLTNAIGIFLQFETKKKSKNQTDFFFKDFKPLISLDSNKFQKHVETLIEFGKYNESNKISLDIIEKSLEGLKYFQTYDWILLRTIVSFGYVSWMIYSTLSTLELYGNPNLNGKGENKTLKIVIGLFLSCVLLLILWLKTSPIQYYIYASFPIFFYFKIIQSRIQLRFNLIKGIVVPLSVYCGGLIFLVGSYYDRFYLAFGCFILSFWSFLKKSSMLLSVSWFITLNLLAVSFFRPVVKIENVFDLNFGVLCILLTSALGLIYIKRVINHYNPFCIIQIIVFILNSYIVSDTIQNLSSKAGLPLLNQYLIFSLSLLFWNRRSIENYYDRTLIIFLAFATPYHTLTISYETQFYSFSFQLNAVYRLTTVFNPFIMGTLVSFKILIPFFLISSILSLISKKLSLPPFCLFLIVISSVDVMTLIFFFMVRDSGSWLEIGTSISQFIISGLFIVFLFILYVLSLLLMPLNDLKFKLE